MANFDIITNNFDSLKYINNKILQNNTNNSVPNQYFKNDSFVKKVKNKKTLIIGSAIAVLAVITTTCILARKGLLGSRLKNFADNIFTYNKSKLKNTNFQKEVSNSKSCTAKAKSKPDMNISTENIPVKIDTEDVISRRREAIDKLRELCPDSCCGTITVGDNGKINGYFLQEIDMAKDKMYSSLRYANYSSVGDKTIESITETPSEKIFVSHNSLAGDWNYRTPIPLINLSGAKERISLNVRPEKELIRRLDDYFSAHVNDIRGWYKTPGDFEGWAKRHDPITIYLFDSAKGTTVLEDIAKITQPYAREGGNSVLIGNRFGNCCSHLREAQDYDYEFLKNRFIKIFGQENVSKRQPYGIKLGSNPHLSAGEFWSYNEVFNRITGENIQVLIP